MRDHNDPVSECKVPRCCFYVCVFPPSRRGGSCDSFYCHTALGALTASEGPSERPNVNLMTWRWANDKYARWRWQPFSFFFLHLYDFFSPVPRSCFLKAVVMLHLLQRSAQPVKFNNTESSLQIYMLSTLCKKKPNSLICLLYDNFAFF